jgi:hypothetical protein
VHEQPRFSEQGTQGVVAEVFGVEVMDGGGLCLGECVHGLPDPILDICTVSHSGSPKPSKNTGEVLIRLLEK